MKTNQISNWREKYVNILLHGPDKSEYSLAAELIDAGYAKGKFLRNMSVPGNQHLNVIWHGPTTLGREYLDELQTKLKHESLRFRALTAAWGFIVWLIGLLSAPLLSWLLGT